MQILSILSSTSTYPAEQHKQAHAIKTDAGFFQVMEEAASLSCSHLF